METGGKNKYTIKAVTKACKVIRAMLSNRLDNLMSVADIAKVASIDKSSCYRLLVTLGEQGIVSQDADGKYRIGIGLVQIGQTAMSRLPFTSLAADVLRKLSAATGQSAYLYIYSNNSRMCIAKHESPQVARHYVPIGDPIPLYVGSSGKVLLAAMNEEQLGKYFRITTRTKLGPNTISSEFLLREEIRRIRQEGIAISKKERSNDSASLAAPIRNCSGAVVGALSIAGPSDDYSKTNIQAWDKEIREASFEISQILGFDPNRVQEKWALEKIN